MPGCNVVSSGYIKLASLQIIGTFEKSVYVIFEGNSFLKVDLLNTDFCAFLSMSLKVCSEAQEFPFLIKVQIILLLLVLGFHYPRKFL